MLCIQSEEEAFSFPLHSNVFYVCICLCMSRSHHSPPLSSLPGMMDGTSAIKQHPAVDAWHPAAATEWWVHWHPHTNTRSPVWVRPQSSLRLHFLVPSSSTCPPGWPDDVTGISGQPWINGSWWKIEMQNLQQQNIFFMAVFYFCFCCWAYGTCFGLSFWLMGFDKQILSADRLNMFFLTTKASRWLTRGFLKWKSNSLFHFRQLRRNCHNLGAKEAFCMAGAGKL